MEQNDNLYSSVKIRREGDRLLGFRDTSNVQVSHFNLFNDNEEEDEIFAPTTPMKSPYPAALSKALFGDKVKNGALENEKILALTLKAPPPTPEYHESLRNTYFDKRINTPRRRARHLQSKEVRILDAPGIKDDYYTEVIEWSKNNMLAVILGNALGYCRINAQNHPTSPHILYEFSEEEEEQEEEGVEDSKKKGITSLAWCPVSDHLCFAVTKKRETTLDVWDVATGQPVRTLRGHEGRVHSLDWRSDASLLASGSSDKTIRTWDVRVAQACVSTLEHHHTCKVTGVRWNLSGTELVSGGNDNIANVFSSPSSSNTAPRLTLSEHQAAVKAIAWCPWQSNLLATGGGTHDKAIKTWNTVTGVMLDSIDTGNQVTSLLWSKSTRELISSHGKPENKIVVWSYPTLNPLVEWNTHTGRVIDITLSPYEKTLLSASADETIKFWTLTTEEEAEADQPTRAYSMSTIR